MEDLQHAPVVLDVAGLSLSDADDGEDESC
jgi:hypothetical protein